MFPEKLFLGARILAHQVKLLLGMPASDMGNGSIPAAPLAIQLAANVPGKQ